MGFVGWMAWNTVKVYLKVAAIVAGAYLFFVLLFAIIGGVMS